jgi:hypothetical protein
MGNPKFEIRNPKYREAIPSAPFPVSPLHFFVRVGGNVLTF